MLFFVFEKSLIKQNKQSTECLNEIIRVVIYHSRGIQLFGFIWENLMEGLVAIP
jgi:hypothetical protein